MAKIELNYSSQMRYLDVRGCPGRHHTVPQTGGFNKRSVFPHSSGSWKSKLRVPANVVSGEHSLSGL